MNYVINNQSIKPYKLILEEYFALKIDMGYVWGEAHQSFEISKDDNCLFEFSVDGNNELCEAMLITTTNYSIKNEDLRQIVSSQEGVIAVENPKNLVAEKFEVEVFNNGLQITFSENLPTKAYKQGDLIIYLGGSDEITSLQVWNLSNEEQNHLLTELQYNMEGKS
ncbi:MAG: hypothetical protein IJE25_04590 [Clostridia bacterium]|nr:hypothetical protein [Clostridia bacterium]